MRGSYKIKMRIPDFNYQNRHISNRRDRKNCLRKITYDHFSENKYRTNKYIGCTVTAR